MSERPEDIIAARQRRAEEEELAQLREQADQFVPVIRKVLPFAVENIKRHNYPSESGYMSRYLDMIPMWLGSGPEQIAWGSRHSGFAITADGVMYRLRSLQSSQGSRLWWEPGAIVDRPMPTDLQEARNHVYTLGTELVTLDNLATKLMSTTGRHHKTGFNPNCVECKMAYERRTPREEIPEGYPVQEVDALISPNKPRIKPRPKGFKAQLKAWWQA